MNLDTRHLPQDSIEKAEVLLNFILNTHPKPRIHELESHMIGAALLCAMKLAEGDIPEAAKQALLCRGLARRLDELEVERKERVQQTIAELENERKYCLDRHHSFVAYCREQGDAYEDIDDQHSVRAERLLMEIRELERSIK